MGGKPRSANVPDTRLAYQEPCIRQREGNEGGKEGTGCVGGVAQRRRLNTIIPTVSATPIIPIAPPAHLREAREVSGRLRCARRRPFTLPLSLSLPCQRR